MSTNMTFAGKLTAGPELAHSRDGGELTGLSVATGATVMRCCFAELVMGTTWVCHLGGRDGESGEKRAEQVGVDNCCGGVGVALGSRRAALMRQPVTSEN